MAFLEKYEVPYDPKYVFVIEVSARWASRSKRGAFRDLPVPATKSGGPFGPGLCKLHALSSFECLHGLILTTTMSILY